MISESEFLGKFEGVQASGGGWVARCPAHGDDNPSLSIARGVQNKVLEALAMGLPTVLTPGAATGIEACDGRDFIIGDTDDALADAVVGLAGDPVRRQVMGRAARGWILANADWGAALAGLAGHLGMTLQSDAVEHAA